MIIHTLLALAALETAPQTSRPPITWPPIGDRFDHLAEELKAAADAAKETDIHRVPWTVAGGQFLVRTVGELCRNGGATKCKSVKAGGTNTDHGVQVYLSSGKYLFTFNRAHAEEIQQDSAAAREKAEEHFPWSMHIAKKEAEKSELEYIAIACSTGFGTYCGGMAAKLPARFMLLVQSGCAGSLALCQKWVKDEQAKIQKHIDAVLAECAKGDQECFDRITGGQETAARLESANQVAGGERPPHTPTRPDARPQFMPGGGDASPYEWWDKSCKGCSMKGEGGTIEPVR